MSIRISLDNNLNFVEVQESELEQNWSMRNPTPSGGELKNIIRVLSGAKSEGE